MQSQIPELLGRTPGATYYLTGIIAAVTLFTIRGVSDRPSLDKIPTVGSNTWLGSWWAGITFFMNATAVVQEGYDKYKGTPFKVSTFSRWMVILSGLQHVEDIRRSRDDEFSFLAGAADTFKTDRTIPDSHLNPYHVAILRSRLNPNLSGLHADIKDEIVTAFDEVLKLEGQEWKTFPALTTVRQITSRTTNRALVGLPLCRNPEWVDLSVQFAIDIIKGAVLIGIFPNFMVPLVTRFMTNIHRSNRRSVEYLTPIFEVRRKELQEYGASLDGGPNDFISWLMQGSKGAHRNASSITSRVLATNLGALHGISNAFTQALYNLAANSQYIQPLREEVESILKEEGWTRTAIEKMHKIDSFVKETLRMDEITLVSTMRRAMKDVTLSDGTVIPKGTYVVVANRMMHHDNEFYEDPDVFDPFRFAKMRTGNSADVQHQSSSVGSKYLVFGYGKHACPGRFFVQCLLNTVLAHVVISYDIKLEDNVIRPKNVQTDIFIIANPTARIMLRRRVD